MRLLPHFRYSHDSPLRWQRFRQKFSDRQWVGFVIIVSVLGLGVTTAVAQIAIQTLGSVISQQQPFPNGYDYRREITIDAGEVDANLTNFPVFVSGSYSYLATDANGGQLTNANGYDLAFSTDSSGSNPLDYEVEQHDLTNGDFSAWIKVPSISSSTDTTLYLFYGNDAISSSQQSPTAVWSNDFEGVWHMNSIASQIDPIGEVGTFTSPNDGGWLTVTFNRSYVDPVVVGTVNTDNGQAGMTFEAKSVTASSAQMRICQDPGGGNGTGCVTHSGETVGYMVIDAAEVDKIDGVDAGTVSVSGQFAATTADVDFDSSINGTPYVFAAVNTVNGGDPIEARVNNVTSSDFDAGLCEHDGNDNCASSHPSETFAWVAFDTGVQPFVKRVESGETSISSSNWTAVTYSQAFSQTPMLLVEQQTNNGGQNGEVDEGRDVTTTGADIRYCELDNQNVCNSHTGEDVAWLAMEPGDLTPDGDFLLDSTANANHGGAFGGLGAGDIVAGQLGDGLDFDGSNDFVNLALPASLDFTGPFSVCSWFNADNDNTFNPLLSKGDDQYILKGTSSDSWEFKADGQFFTSGSINTNNWDYVCGTYDGTTLSIYVNGNYTDGPNTGSITSDNFPIYIGSNSETASRFADGTIDGMQVAGSARSSGWVTTSFNNQSTPGSFYQIGPESINIVSNDWYDTAWTQRKAVTINNSANASTLTNYQLPLSISYDGDMQTDFDDLRFTNSSQQGLDYWVEEKTNGSSATVWVEIDLIPASTTSYIYMYYGNASVSSANSLSDTFRQDQIHLTTADNNGEFGDNHTQFEQLIANIGSAGYAFEGSGYVTDIDDSNNPYGADDTYLSRYRLLFQADATGSYSFGTNSDDGSELNQRGTGDTTSSTVLASWYGPHGSGTCGSSGTQSSLSLTSGDVLWFDYRQSENTGGQLAQLCIDDPGGGGYQTFNTTNFSGQFFSRTITDGTEPNSTTGNEEFVGDVLIDPGIIIDDTQSQLVGHWPFDGDAQDATPYGSNGSVSGAVLATDRYNQADRAYDFDGSNDTLQAPGISIPTGDFTYSAWINPDSLNDEVIFMASDGSGANELIIAVGTSGTSGRIRLYLNNSNRFQTSTGVSANQWSHVVVTREGSSVKVFINGIQDATTDSYGSTLNFGSCALLIGVDADSGCTGGFSNHFNGTIDDARVYNRAIDTSEIDRLYDGYRPQIKISELQRDLVGHYEFSGNAEDRTPYSRTASLSGGSYVTDKRGGAQGAHDFALGQNGTITGLMGQPADITLSAWVNLDATDAGGGELISLGDSVAIRLDAGGDISCFFYNGSTWQSTDVSQTIAGSGWRHIAYTFDDSTDTQVLYIDGQAVATTGHSGSIAYTLGTNTTLMQHGNGSTTFDSDGRLDDVRVYSRPLTAAEIEFLYENE